MHPKLTDELSAIRTLAADFTAEFITPHAKTWDEKSIFPMEVLRVAAKLGFGGIYIKEDVGGSNLSRLAGTLIFEELAVGCASTAAYISIHNMVAAAIDRYGNHEQRERFLPALISMEKFSSYCLTEPDAGSDAASLKSSAVDAGDHYVINGAKSFISGGSVSDLYLCMVRTAATGSKGISCIVIEKDTAGLSFGKLEQKLGWKSQPTSMVFFSNCKVPKANRIGDEGQGFKIAVNALNGGRINIGACSLGGGQACFDYAKQYLSERKQFGKPLKDLEVLQFQMADLFTELTSARLQIHHAAQALDEHNPDAPVYCAMAKRVATDAGFNIANTALQLYGGYGYLKDYPIERYFRDLRVHQILEGTNEIMRTILAKKIFQ